MHYFTADSVAGMCLYHMFEDYHDLQNSFHNCNIPPENELRIGENIFGRLAIFGFQKCFICDHTDEENMVKIDPSQEIINDFINKLENHLIEREKYFYYNFDYPGHIYIFKNNPSQET